MGRILKELKKSLKHCIGMPGNVNFESILRLPLRMLATQSERGFKERMMGLIDMANKNILKG